MSRWSLVSWVLAVVVATHGGACTDDGPDAANGPVAGSASAGSAAGASGGGFGGSVAGTDAAGSGGTPSGGSTAVGSPRPITSDGSGFAGHWTLLWRSTGDDDADSHTHELVEEGGNWVMKDCEWQPPCEPEPWICEPPPPEVMASGSAEGDMISLDTGSVRDGVVTRVHWDLTHVDVGTLRGTVGLNGCAGDCPWPALGCHIETGLYPLCDETADFTGLLNCTCAPPECR